MKIEMKKREEGQLIKKRIDRLVRQVTEGSLKDPLKVSLIRKLLECREMLDGRLEK